MMETSVILMFLGIAHLHYTTPALAGGARERSAMQVSRERALLSQHLRRTPVQV
jgi:hypothetical protein